MSETNRPSNENVQRLKRYYDSLSRVYDLQERLPLEKSCYARARLRAVEMLKLGPGSVVLDVACGTGVNLPLLQCHLHGTGRIIAVDNSDAMLRRAQARTGRADWQNVRCVQADAALLGRGKLGKVGALEPEQPIDAAICTFGLSVIQNWEMAYDAMRSLIRPGGRIAVVDVSCPEGTSGASTRHAIRLLWRLLCWLGRADADRRPWLKLTRDLPDAVVETFSSGFVAVASGTVPPAPKAFDVLAPPGLA